MAARARHHRLADPARRHGPGRRRSGHALGRRPQLFHLAPRPRCRSRPSSTRSPQYLPADPEVSAYIAKHSRDTGYSRGDEIDYDASIADLDQAVKAKPQDAELRLRPRPLAGGRRRDRCGDRRLHDGPEAGAGFSGGPAVAQPEPLRPRRQREGRSRQGDRRSHHVDRPLQGLRRAHHESRYIYSRDHRYDEAAGDFTEVLRLRPKSSGALRARAGIYAELKQFDQAAEDYDRAIDLEPDLPISYIARGNFRSQLGRMPRRSPISIGRSSFILRPRRPIAAAPTYCCSRVI